MTDSETTIAELKKVIDDFNTAHGWQKYHAPRNLAMSISIEAAELLELWQWEDDDEIGYDIYMKYILPHIKDELAGVMIYSIDMANVLDIDIFNAIRRKIEKNAIKYPEVKID